MRCFIAVDLPEGVKESLRELQQFLKDNCELYGVKASFNKDHHITLKFLGEITPAAAKDVRKSLAGVEVSKLKVSASHLGVFPGGNQIRIIWIGIAPEDGILKLVSSIDQVLEKEFPKQKNFKAHVTLARVKFVRDKTGFLRLLKAMKVEKKKFDISKFKLKESVLGDEPVYKNIEVYG